MISINATVKIANQNTNKKRNNDKLRSITNQIKFLFLNSTS